MNKDFTFVEGQQFNEVRLQLTTSGEKWLPYYKTTRMAGVLGGCPLGNAVSSVFPLSAERVNWYMPAGISGFHYLTTKTIC